MKAFGFFYFIIVFKMVKRKNSEELEEGNGKSKDNDEYVYDEVTGGRGKKKVLDVLNKSKLSKHEMDEVFCEWE